MATPTPTNPSGNGSVAVTRLAGFTPTGSVADLYLSSPGDVFGDVDTGGYDVAPTSAVGVTTVATLTATAGDANLRGPAFVPTATFAAAVPEPTSVGVAVVGTAGLLARRRRRRA